MKKIGIYLDFEPSGGGSYQYAASLLGALVGGCGANTRIVAFHTNREWLRHLDVFGVRGVFIRKPFSWRAGWWLWRRLGLSVPLWRGINRRFNPWAKAILSEQCDLCFFPTQNLDAVQLPIPSLVSVHDLMHRYERGFPEVGEAKEYRNREYLYSMICRFSSGVLVDSEVGKRQLIESYGVNPEKVHVLPFTVPNYLLKREIVAKSRLPFDLPERYLFYPAQFWSHKNHLGLLHAVKSCVSQGILVNLVFCGTPKNANEGVLEFINSNQLQERVTILEYVPDEFMASLYHYSEGLIYPSFFGPTNIPPLEAIWMGKPLAISGVYGMKDLCGDLPIFFDPSNIEQIEGALKSLWEGRTLGRSPEQVEEMLARIEPAAFQNRLEMILASMDAGR